MSASQRLVTITLPEDLAPDRADKILAAHLAPLSRVQVQRLLDNGGVSLAARPAVPLDRKHKLAPGDTLHVLLPEETPAAPVPADIPLEILFEDAHLLAVNKASGTITHPGAGTGGDTLVHAALHHTQGALAPSPDPSRPGVVHRLDKDTSGVLLLAKTPEASQALIRQFSEREPDKQYLALVHGRPALLSGSIREPIGRHPTNRVRMAVREEDGKPAHTDWVVEERFGVRAARLRCWLRTGRTHQIRVHLAHIGHPLLGDAAYGGKIAAAAANRQPPVPAAARVMLHAERISLAHPVTGVPLLIRAPLPADFPALEAQLRAAFGGETVEHFAL